MKAEAVGVPIPKNSRVAKQLLAEDRRDLKEKKRQQSQKFKSARYSRYMQNYSLYDSIYYGPIEEVTYKKDLCEPDMLITASNDHTYGNVATPCLRPRLGIDEAADMNTPGKAPRFSAGVRQAAECIPGPSQKADDEEVKDINM